MRKYLNKTFMGVFLALASISIFIGMVTGPFGLTEISIGFSVAGVLFASSIVIFALVKWHKVRRRKR